MAKPRHKIAIKPKIDMNQQLGNMSNLGEKEKEFIRIGLKKKDIFKKLPRPGVNDWLSEHKEFPQSVRSSEKMLQHTVFPSRLLKTKIYLASLDKDINTSTVSINKTGKSEPFLVLLQKFASIFFKGFTVEILPLPKKKANQPKFKTRINEATGKPQLFVPDVYQYLESKFPPDAFCMVGITMVDLYPDETWNFVFGQAVPRSGVGVFSFARYDPSFHLDEELSSACATLDKPQTSTVVLWRSCKVMCHEICHLFCLMHCVHFSCAMNGSNHEEEANHRPMFLCPVCLVKLKSTKLNFDIKERYAEMLEFFKSIEDENFAKAAEWTEKALTFL